jgi:prepilin-type N-terminal cleavage/methylation domain-containing protein
MRLHAKAHRSQDRSSSRSGFTLMEVLLTLFIMSGILLTMTQILNAARTSRDTIHNIQETQLAGPAILDLIERDLRGLVVHGRAQEQHLRTRDRAMLGLDGDSLDFVTSTNSLTLEDQNDRYVRADINEVGYRLRPRADQDDFLEIFRRESFGVDDEPFEGGQFTFLHDRVKGFDIQVFIEDGPDAEPEKEWLFDEGATPPSTSVTGEDLGPVGLPARLEITLTLELAPRIVREQLMIAPVDRRTMIYRRVIRLPESLRLAEADIPVIVVPSRDGPGADGTAAGAGAGEDGEDGENPEEEAGNGQPNSQRPGGQGGNDLSTGTGG